MRPLPVADYAPMDERLQELLDAVSTNPSTVRFQRTLNEWLTSICSCWGAAFSMYCHETGQCSVTVCGDVVLDEPLNFGDVELISGLFAYRDEVPSSQLSPPMLEKVRRLRAVLRCGEEEGGGAATLLPVRAKVGLVATLLVFHRSESSAADDLRKLQPHARLIAALFSIVVNIDEQRRLAQQGEIFLAMAQNVFSSIQDMSMLVRNITKEAKALVQAETCSLFLLDKEHSELVAEVFEKNGMTDEYLAEIRLPLDQGIVGHVATTGAMMNVKDAYSHPLFYRNVDQRTGFFTRNILCFPIKDSESELVGVAELCNKIGRTGFTESDEQIATTFAIYCAISISHCLLYRKLQEAHRRSNLASELMVYDSHLQIAEEDIMRLSMRDVPSPASYHEHFGSLQFLPRQIASSDKQVEACVSMFQDLGLVSRWRIRRRTLSRFLCMVQKGYRDVPYHNWSHAFAVCHFAYLLLKLPAVGDYLTDLERLALLAASLCHDIDHRGTTNAFQVQSKTPLAQLYSSEGSVLERHHFAQTICILNIDDCNIFDGLTRRDYQQVLDHIREIILATDIAAHLRKFNKLQKMVKAVELITCIKLIRNNRSDGFDKEKAEHHYSLLCLLMTAADLSDQAKAWRNSKAIAARIYAEFFSQGDLEKAMGNCPSESMDRERACVPKIQLDFLDTVALPLYDLLRRLLPQCSGVYEATVRSRRCWQLMAQLLGGDGGALFGVGLDVLDNEQLERRVLEEWQREQSSDAAAR